MRIKENSIRNFLKGHMAASLIDTHMDMPNPFQNDEHLVVTGSSIPYYLWHSGQSDDYLYKPPSDIDLVLATPPGQHRSHTNIPIYQQQIESIAKKAAKMAGYSLLSSNSTGRYDRSITVERHFEPDEIQHVINNTRIQEVLDKNDISDLKITRPRTIQISMDMMVLDNTILPTQAFETHPNAQQSLLRHQSPAASLAFKMARSTLQEENTNLYARPGDFIDMYNIFNAHGYEHDPKLLRVMAVIALAQQVSPSFEPACFTGESLKKNQNDFKESMQSFYGFNFSDYETQKILDFWHSLSEEVFPHESSDAPLLSEEEDEFIINFLMPYSGDPKESIRPELLAQNNSLRDVFNKHDTLIERVKNSSFFQQRITFQQDAPYEVEI